MCLLKIAIFEVYASLKQKPGQPKLKSGTCIIKKRKTQLSRLTLHAYYFFSDRWKNAFLLEFQ